MNLVELDHALRKLRLSGMADVVEARLRQAQAEKLAPLDLVATLVADELQRRQDRLLARRHKQARFRDPDRSLDSFDFDFNKKMNRALIHDLATVHAIHRGRSAATRRAVSRLVFRETRRDSEPPGYIRATRVLERQKSAYWTERFRVGLPANPGAWP